MSSQYSSLQVEDHEDDHQETHRSSRMMRKHHASLEDGDDDISSTKTTIANQSRQECCLLFATVCGFLMLVAAFSLHNNEWEGFVDLDVVVPSPTTPTTEGGNNNNSYLRGSNDTTFEYVDDPEAALWDTIQPMEDLYEDNEKEKFSEDILEDEFDVSSTDSQEEEEEELSDATLDSTTLAGKEQSTTIRKSSPSSSSSADVSLNQDQYEIQLENEETLVARMEDEHSGGP